jgi:predicted TIM-barrel fold metal-dependent hydrolase
VLLQREERHRVVFERGRSATVAESPVSRPGTVGASPSSGTVDACVHPFVRNADELREFMPKALRARFFPGLGRHFYPAPASEFRADVVGDGATGLQQALGGTKTAPAGVDRAAAMPGSDPATLKTHVLDEGMAAHAILVPLTRGLLPDAYVVNAICEATNQWLVDVWLSDAGSPRRFSGSIRVNPADADHAVREIRRWADHPGMVQVAVSLESHQPYGQKRFNRVWKVAADHGLPVAVVGDRANGVEFAPTFVGFPTHYIEFAAQKPLTYLYHLVSLIGEGVFERIPSARFVFTDGGIDMLMPIMWRFENGWRPSQAEVPWMRRPPSAYLGEHIRLCTGTFEGPTDASVLRRWLDVAHASELLMYASHYPFRRRDGIDRFNSVPAERRAAILGGTAHATYAIAG